MHRDLYACRDAHHYYYADLPERYRSTGVWSFEQRFEQIEPYLGLEPDDRVLDVGCAEGLITLAVAERVTGRVHGVEIQGQRVEAATSMAHERGLDHLSFETNSACDLRPVPQSYDVILFLGVYHHLPKERREATLERMYQASRRRLVIKTPLGQRGARGRFETIAEIGRACGFAVERCPATVKKGGDLVIAQRHH